MAVLDGVGAADVDEDVLGDEGSVGFKGADFEGEVAGVDSVGYADVEDGGHGRFGTTSDCYVT